MSGLLKLIIFDVDGTLAERVGDALLPGVFAWFAAHGQEYKIALATNQGGVGLRYWMETDGFGEPGKYPDEQSIWAQLGKIVRRQKRRAVRFDRHRSSSTQARVGKQAEDAAADAPRYVREREV